MIIVMRVVCAWCDQLIGAKDGESGTSIPISELAHYPPAWIGTSHTICPACEREWSLEAFRAEQEVKNRAACDAALERLAHPASRQADGHADDES